MSSKIFISKSALVHNLRAYRRAVGGAQVMAVVKANAYGHGITEVARAIEREADWFGVASGDEALVLRQAGIRKPILVLSFYDESQIRDLVAKNIALAVYDLRQAKLISQAAKKLKKTATVHLKVDTGTSRLGIFPKQVGNFVHEILKLRNLKIQGVFSHFAASEENAEYTKRQNHLFNAAIEELEWRGIDPIKHIACTAAGILSPDSEHDLVRLGIGLYGLWPSQKASRSAKFDLRPALSWQSHIIQVKDLPAHTNVGYALNFTTKHATKVAVLPVGYFDGVDRKLSNNGDVLIGGKRCPIIGNICMNMMMVDVTKVKNAKAGDKVVLIGQDGREEITADEWAAKIGTINYEVVTRINPLIPRILK